LWVDIGVQYVHALGEIYRVAEIVGVSAKLHKPWMLSGSIDRTSLFALLDECNSLWLASGLEEALSSISNHNNLDADGISRELVQSIKYIHELDEHALQSYVISGEETMCQLSALPAECLPGIYTISLAVFQTQLIKYDLRIVFNRKYFFRCDKVTCLSMMRTNLLSIQIFSIHVSTSIN
jgi:hypothetical protein